ncbi:hypothetical protein SAMN05720471_12412 [Fibrobacter sp. UWP2]|nr:hypothetical protein SAMN05720471_12412 [Fibrobacter sp. UWP2]
MDESENKFLHKINLETLKKETGKTIEEIAKLVGIGPKVVYKWQYMHKDGSRPDFNAVVKLLQAGASVETLFGVDYADTHRPAPEPVSAAPSPEFLKAHPELLEGFREQLMEDLMKKGLVPEEKVKDIVRQEIERLLPSAKPINKF